ncbi:hypothetical protein [Aestuariivirga sp.]|uniref:sunset domain-containing protein n=1 Tax=Aestuariivirga sp. TaxID=2650926 RepID=UPI0039188D83
MEFIQTYIQGLTLSGIFGVVTGLSFFLMRRLLGKRKSKPIVLAPLASKSSPKGAVEIPRTAPMQRFTTKKNRRHRPYFLMRSNRLQQLITWGLVAGFGVALVAYQTGIGPRLIGCGIKGNIAVGTGEKIYHVPGQQYYPDTHINLMKGERWFCSERSAVAAGWRKSRI